MSPEQFVYWLQGYSELSNERPSAEAWKSIQEHLNLVLKKVTPPLIQAAKVDSKNISIDNLVKRDPVTVPYPFIPPQPYQYPQAPDTGGYWLKDSFGPGILNCNLTC